jgi:hypothetical protein
MAKAERQLLEEALRHCSDEVDQITGAQPGS